MVAVNPTVSSALAALQIVKPRTETGTPQKPQMAPGIEPMSMSLSPNVSDALLKISELVNGKASVESSGEAQKPYYRNEAAASQEIPEEHRQFVKSLGSGEVAIRAKEQVSDEEFQSRVMDWMMEVRGDDPEFQQALKDGTAKIQRASDVPELGYKTYIYDLYRDGSLVGGAGAATANVEWYLEQAEAGVRQATGTVEGLDYYVTW